MKHTRVPRTVRRDIWRLAIETSSIPSLHIFRSRIRNQIASRIESRKYEEWAEPRIKLPNKEKNIHIPCSITTWADWCGARFALAPNLLTRITSPRKFNLPYAISDQTSLLCTNFVPTLISPTLYGMLYSVVMFLHQRTKDTITNNPIDQSVDMYSPWRCCYCCRWLGVSPKMKSGRPIKIRINIF